MNKKSQFYMFAGLLFILSVFMIIGNNSLVEIEEIRDFESYMDNYKKESINVINNAIYHDSNVSESLMNYTEKFLEYTESKSLEIGIVYLYSKNNYIYIVNYLNEPILISSINQELTPGREKRLDFREETTLRYNNETYTFELRDPGEIEFKILFVKENE